MSRIQLIRGSHPPGCDEKEATQIIGASGDFYPNPFAERFFLMKTTLDWAHVEILIDASTN